ncbi:MAG TPA: glycogen debranching protein GlgX [Nevskia sp.]|nr:glycogen debranching protein GlgX [Nevskia sp.]
MPETTADRLLPSSWPRLGPHWDGRGTHFAVFSEHAERIELCVFDGSGRHETRLQMPDCSDGVWRGYLPGARPGTLYGYRAYGPYDPARGLRFNNHKLLLDPYARRLHGELRWHDALYGYRVGHARADLAYDRRNSAEYMPKAVVADDHYDWGGDHPPRVPWSETVIYELHVKGWSRLNERIPPNERGTFGGLGHPASIDYLRRLGVTAVELLPVHAFARDRNLLERQLTNYWGYNTLAYFAPDPAYLSDGTSGQFKWAVQQLHAAGIEVILDVVYNHTCEGNELGPTLSWRGLDNCSYYRLAAGDPRHYVNDTGCGNTVNLSHPRVIQMVLDSLRWWAAEYRVDGFRFDLGATLGREEHGFDPGCGFFDALLQDPLLSGLKLISEPWDVGLGGYQLGRHPPGFAEWNDKFRSCARRYWRGDPGMRGALAAVLQGTAELFDHRRRRPWASLNFVTAHDGYTLRDLVSYEAKHNEANGEDNRDGSDHNDSRNWGAEGPTDDQRVEAQRRRAQRSLLCTLFLSHGTPMLLAGDEFGQTQQGNNNAYCQDNELSWLDWRLAESAEGKALADFVANLIRIRREHPVFQGLWFQHGQAEPAHGLKDIFWFDERGNELAPADWDNPNARLLGVRRALARDDGRIEVAILLFNADEAPHEFQLPQPRLDYRLIAASEEPEGAEPFSADQPVSLAAHSVAVLLAQPEAQSLPQPAAPQASAQNDATPDDGVVGAAA